MAQSNDLPIWHDGKKVGRLEYRLEDNGDLFLDFVGVDPSYRQQGIASRALTSLRRRYSDNTWRANIISNHSLRAFCRALGFPKAIHSHDDRPLTWQQALAHLPDSVPDDQDGGPYIVVVF